MSTRARACVLTPTGRGAVATVGFRGNVEILNRLFRPVRSGELTERALNQLVFGTWGTEFPEEVVAVRTGEQSAEIHCHGGPQAVTRILNDLADSVSVLSAEEWTLEETSTVEAECQLALTRASTLRSSLHLLEQATRLPHALHALAGMSAVEQRKQIDDLLAWADFAIHLVEPWQVVLCGRPNVGKSSLINALLGFTRAVVSAQAGTTRDVVSSETALDGWAVEFSDTAGLRASEHELEAEGIRRARARGETADVLVLVLDAGTGLKDEDRELLAEFPQALVVWNKIDLGDLDSLPVIPHFRRPLAVSATSGQGLDKLTAELVRRLVPREPVEVAIPISRRQVQRLQALKSALEVGDTSRFESALAEWIGRPDRCVP